MRDLFTFISELKLSPEVRDFRPPTGEMKGGEQRSCGGGLLNSLTSGVGALFQSATTL